jgi:putative heme-binding domain-containing protein
VPLLLRLWRETDREDTYLIHTIRMALRDQLAQDEIFREYAHFDGDADRRRRLLDILLGLPKAHAAEFVLTALKTGRYDPTRLDEFIRFATRHASADELDAVSGYVLTWQTADPQLQMLVFRSYGQALAERGAQFSPPMVAWAEKLAGRLLTSSDPADRLEGIQLAESLRLRLLYEPVARIAADREEETQQRVSAVQACVSIADPRCVELIDGILGNRDESLTLRRASARALSSVSGDESRQVFYTHLLTAHHRLAIALAAGLAKSQAGAGMLLNAIAEGKASPLLLRELRVLMALKVTKVPDLTSRIAKLTENLPPADEMTAQQIVRRRQAYLAAKPDVDLGRPVFTKQCEVCHQMSGQGKKFGPDLDGIGVRGLDRLLEDLLDPSRNVDPAFQTTIVITDRGLTHTGLAVRDEGKVLLLVDSEGKQLRIPHDEIDERYTSALSPMPAALEKALTDEEFNHLMRFLLDANEPLKPSPDQPAADRENGRTP